MEARPKCIVYAYRLKKSSQPLGNLATSEICAWHNKKKGARSRSQEKTSVGWILERPTDNFTTLELQNMSHQVLELHTFGRSHDIEALKLRKIRSGARNDGHEAHIPFPQISQENK